MCTIVTSVQPFPLKTHDKAGIADSGNRPASITDNIIRDNPMSFQGAKSVHAT